MLQAAKAASNFGFSTVCLSGNVPGVDLGLSSVYLNGEYNFLSSCCSCGLMIEYSGYKTMTMECGLSYPPIAVYKYK